MTQFRVHLEAILRAGVQQHEDQQEQKKDEEEAHSSSFFITSEIDGVDGVENGGIRASDEDSGGVSNDTASQNIGQIGGIHYYTFSVCFMLYVLSIVYI